MLSYIPSDDLMICDVFLYLTESLWVPQNSVCHAEDLEGSRGGGPGDGGSGTGRPPTVPVGRGDGYGARGTHPQPQRPVNARQKYPMHRKVLTNNSLAPPGRRAPNKRPLNYNKIPMPHRLVDPREGVMEGTNNPGYHSNSLKRGGDQSNASSTNMDHSQQVPSSDEEVTKVPSCGANTQPSQTKEPVYCNTFGQNFPLRPLGRVDENQDELSDDSGTTTSGSYDMEHPPDRHRIAGVTHMDTVV